MMRKYLFLLIMLLLSVQLALAQKYEYWLDNDYLSRTIVSNATDSISFNIDISQESIGLHHLTIRLQNENGEWGGLTRYMFYVPEQGDDQNNLVRYEYWIDNQYDNKTTVLNDSVASTFSIDISQLNTGVHSFSFRTQSASGQWGGLTRYLFYVNHEIAQSDYTLSGIELWIDEDRNYIVSQEASDSLVVTMNITDLPKGDHLLHVYGKTPEGRCILFESLSFNAPHLPVVPTPVITHNGNTITITDGKGVDSDSVIDYRYTLDGTTPTSKSTKYEGPFEVTRNDTLRVIGIQYAHENSEIAELVIDWFKVNMPECVQKGNTLTLSCSTPTTTIYYRLGDGEEQAYSAPIRLPDQLLVTAVGRRTGYDDSDPLIIQTRQVKSAKPVATYDGHYLRVSSSEEGVNLYYTLDGTSPASGLDVAKTAKSYVGRMTIDTLCTLKAVAIIDSLNVSEVLTYDVDYVYNGKTAYVRKAGNLAKAFEWFGGIDKMEQLSIEGTLNNQDIDTLRNMPILTHLNMANVKMSSGQLPTEGFSGAKMVTFVSPKELSSVGGRIFADCPRLASVVWNAEVTLNDNSFEGVNNPNLLLYVKKDKYKPSDMSNVIVNGTASSITLKDNTEGNANFYCPQAFTANEISYTREFKQQTAVGIVRGWESIVLPFTVQTITHESHGALKPFDAEGEGKPFWLMKLEDDGLKHVATIEANQPYVLSMPNNPSVYAEDYNQNGVVTFAARNTEVPVSAPQDNSGLDMILRPVYQKVDKAQGIYALNVGEEVDGNPEGSVFKSDYRDVRPFEVYMLAQQRAATRSIPLSSLFGGGGVTDIIDVMNHVEQTDGRWYDLSGRRLQSKPTTKGIYIMNGKKIVIK